MTINGLPAHPLLVHLVIVMLPLSSLMAIIGSVWPAAQRKFGFLTPLAALVTMIFVPITIQAGLQLMSALNLNTAAVLHHEALGRRLLPLSIALAVTTIGQYVYLRFAARKRWMTVVIAILVIASAVLTTVQVARAGDAGAHLVWTGVVKNP